MPIPLLALAAAMAAAGGIGSAIGASRRSDQEHRNPLEDGPDAETIDPDTTGSFNSVLEAIGRPGHAINDVLVGNWEGAGRQGIDLLGDVVDSVLPGDWIPHISRRMDKADFSDVVGGMDPGIGKFAVDVLGGAATDPTMLLPTGAIGKGIGALGEVAGKGVNALDKVLPGTAKAVETAGRGIRSTFGAQRINPKVRAILAEADKGKLEADAGLGAIKAGPLGAMSDQELGAISDIMDNLLWKDGKVAGRLGEEGTGALDRIALHPEVTPENRGRIAEAVKHIIEIGQNQAARPNIFRKDVIPAFTTTLPSRSIGAGEIVKGADGLPMAMPSRTAWKETAGTVISEPEKVRLPEEYLGRTWTGQTEEQAINDVLGSGPIEAGAPNATKELVLKTPEQINDFMLKNPGMAYERNALTRMAKRAETQGRMASKAEIGKALVGDKFALADSASRAEAEAAIRKMAEADPESAKVLFDQYKGLAPRGALASVLAKANVPFKRAAVAGFLIPKFGADVRNRLSGVWQAFSNQKSRGVTGGMAARAISDIAGSVADAIGMKMGGDKFRVILSDWETALGKSGGSADKAIEILRQTQPKAADLIQSGVLDGYSRAEDLLGALKASKWKKASEFPQRIMRGLEDRMRLGMGLDLMDTGKSAAEAAQITGESLYRYGTTSAANRTARDFIPFFQFTAKAIPQQAALFAEMPGLATGLSRAQDSADNPDAPVYPYMQGRLNVPLGLDQEGNPQFVSGFGLPFEALNMIPDASNDLGKFGRSLERDTIGSSQPLLKTAFGVVSGEDPYFESGFGSYGKIPLLGEAGAAGRAYNVAAGTGLLQPIDSPLRLLNQATDERRGLGTKALDLLTGANVVSVDPNRALQQQLQRELEADPTVQQHRSFYQQSKDPETQARIAAFNAAKQRAKEHARALAADVR